MLMHVLTLIGALSPAVCSGAVSALRAERSVWLAPDLALDLLFTTPPAPDAVGEVLAGAPIDAVLQPVAGRRKRLLVADMDSTIVTTETLDELAAHAGRQAEVAAITAASMAGEIDFAAALRSRVALLRGLPIAALDHTYAATRLMPGAAELVATMRAHGAACALVSGGFTCFTQRVAARLGFDHHQANVLLDDGAVLTGTVAEPILDRAAKRAALGHYAGLHGLTLAECLAVGDGANDLDMLAAAGMGVAYHAQPIVARLARARIDHADLRALLFIQGYASR